MNYTPEQLFPDWYKVADLNASSEIIKFRLAAVKEVFLETELSFWLDIVRIYLNLPLTGSGNKDKFLQIFRTADAAFPFTNNENLLQVLAGSALLFQLNDSEDEICNACSLAVLTSTNFTKQQPDTRIPVIDAANKYLNRIERKIKLTNISGQIGAIESLKGAYSPNDATPTRALTAPESKTIIDGLLQSLKQYQILSEETNILWWLYGEYSSVYNKTFVEIGVNDMAITSAIELKDETVMSIRAVSARHILYKALLIASKGKASHLTEIKLYDFINKTSKNVREDLIGKNSHISLFTPALYAIKKSLDFDPGDDWEKQFKMIDPSIDEKKKCRIEDIAFQLYSEMILLQIIGENGK